MIRTNSELANAVFKHSKYSEEAITLLAHGSRDIIDFECKAVVYAPLLFAQRLCIRGSCNSDSCN